VANDTEVQGWEQASRDYIVRRAAAGTPEGKAYTKRLESLPPAEAAAEIEDMFALSAPEDKAGDISCDLQMNPRKAQRIADVLNGEVPLIEKRIDGDFRELAAQAPVTASSYIAAAVSQIDGHLGEGYAKQHPELIAAYMQTTTLDLGMALIAGALEELAAATDRHAVATRAVSDAIATDLGGVVHVAVSILEALQHDRDMM
jgi:hypothetical protein